MENTHGTLKLNRDYLDIVRYYKIPKRNFNKDYKKSKREFELFMKSKNKQSISSKTIYYPNDVLFPN